VVVEVCAPVVDASAACGLDVPIDMDWDLLTRTCISIFKLVISC
jgi:hypothetical protein